MIVVVGKPRVSWRGMEDGGGGGALMVSIMVVVSWSPSMELWLRRELAWVLRWEALRWLTRGGTVCSSSISGRTLIMHILVGVWWGCDVEGMGDQGSEPRWIHWLKVKIPQHTGNTVSLYKSPEGDNGSGGEKRKNRKKRKNRIDWVEKEALHSVKGGSCVCGLGWLKSWPITPQHQVTSLARACLPTPLQVSRLRVHRRCIHTRYARNAP